MTRCSRARFATKPEARQKRRELIRTLKLTTVTTYCESCDLYHVVAETQQTKLHPSWIPLLNYMAKGYNDTEIANMTGMALGTILYHVGYMKRHFYALSRANLVAIGIALGLVDPNEFVPQIGEHREPSRNAACAS